LGDTTSSSGAAWRRGSWPPLLALSALFVLVFVGVRARSSFLAVEAGHEAALAASRPLGLAAADVMALWALPEAGDDGSAAARQRRLEVFSAERAALGDPLAAVAAAGDAAAARAARAAAAEADGAWRRFSTTRAALPGLRFLQLRERFVQRGADATRH
jgi:hypothetical protein